MELTMNQRWGLTQTSHQEGTTQPAHVAQGPVHSASTPRPSVPTRIVQAILGKSRHFSEPWLPVTGDSYKMQVRGTDSTRTGVHDAACNGRHTVGSPELLSLACPKQPSISSPTSGKVPAQSSLEKWAEPSQGLGTEMGLSAPAFHARVGSGLCPHPPEPCPGWPLTYSQPHLPREQLQREEPTSHLGGR